MLVSIGKSQCRHFCTQWPRNWLTSISSFGRIMIYYCILWHIWRPPNQCTDGSEICVERSNFCVPMCWPWWQQLHMLLVILLINGMLWWWQNIDSRLRHQYRLPQRRDVEHRWSNLSSCGATTNRHYVRLTLMTTIIMIMVKRTLQSTILRNTMMIIIMKFIFYSTMSLRIIIIHMSLYPTTTLNSTTDFPSTYKYVVVFDRH